MRGLLAAWTALAGVLTAAPALAEKPRLDTLPPPPSIEALIGERLDYVIRWGGIPAGRASLEVDASGKERVVLRARAHSLKWIDWVYPVREVVESTVTAPAVLSDRLFKTTLEGRHRTRVEEVVFDRAAGTATYTRDGVARDPLAVPPGVRDALASFYAFRTLALDGAPGSSSEGNRVELQITDGKKAITGTVELLRRDRVRTPAGTFSTVRIEPRIEGIGGVFRKSPGARIFIWLTDDERRRPVKIRTRVALGRVTAELTGWVDGGAHDPRP